MTYNVFGGMLNLTQSQSLVLNVKIVIFIAVFVIENHCVIVTAVVPVL